MRLAASSSARRSATRQIVRWLRTSAPAASVATHSPTLDLSNPRIAFQASSSLDLVRGAAVLTACSQPWLVRHAEPALALSRRLLGPTLTDTLLRHTLFAHFVAGETAEGIRPLLSRLHGCGVGGILDYAAEADLSTPQPSDEAAADDYNNQPARVFLYESETECDANTETFLRCITAVRDATPEGFAAVKVTALGDPQLLERCSTALVELQRFFATLDADGSGALSRDEFVRGWLAAFKPSSDAVEVCGEAQADAEAEAHARFDAIDTQGDGAIDALEWTQSLPLEALPGLVAQCRLAGPLYNASPTADEVDAMRRMLARLDTIALTAKDAGVRLMIDAEHSYFQPAIDNAVLRLQRLHNGGDAPVVFNTYQCYLRDCLPRLELDLERSRREGWQFGAKLVRGAYMEHERARAAELGRADPIQPTAEATHANYDAAVELLLHSPPVPHATWLMVATHNEASIVRAASALLRGEARVPSHQVAFGQLLGMADHLTFALSASGLKAYKYVPWGSVAEVVPYLLRRATENADALSGAPAQRAMMLRELRRRVVGF